MTSNVGNIDRTLRIILGVVLLVCPFVSGAALFESSTATLISVVVGAVVLGTAAMKFCPAYRLLGIKTCKVD